MHDALIAGIALLILAAGLIVRAAGFDRLREPDQWNPESPTAWGPSSWL